MQKPHLSQLISSEKKVLLLVFVFFTLISGVQFLQYFIAYNSSYPFPWKYNLSITFGTFYTYFLFVPLIYRLSARLQQKSLALAPWIGLHLVMALLVSVLHLLLVQLIEWAQVYSFSEATFEQAYRWKLARWLHLELLMYVAVTGLWYAGRLVKWKNASKGNTTGEVIKTMQVLTKLRVKEGNETSFVELDNVRWIEAYDNYIKCFLEDRFVLIRSTLSGIEKGLDKDKFQRIHRSCIVAMREVRKIKNNAGNYEVILTDGSSLKLSRTYKAALEAKLAATVSV